MIRAPLAVLALLAAPLLAGCTAPPEGPAPDVVATFYPLAFFAERIGGDDLRVGTLVPSGVEPHDWEPTPRDAERLRQAKVFVHNGAGLEPWADGLAQDLESQGRIVVEATAGLELQKRASDLEPGQHDGKQQSDPHAWLDPVLGQRMAASIAAAMQQADPANATAHAARAEQLRADLQALDQRFEAGLHTCAKRDILTTHAAFGYLAARYNFTQHSVSGLSPEAEPTPARLQEAVEMVRRLNLSYVFFETLVSPRVAEVIASEAGARTLVLNPIEGLTTDDVAAGRDYLDLADQNLANLRLALECA